jgi:hypothetical protein
MCCDFARQRRACGLVFKANRLVCHSTLGWRVIKKKKKKGKACLESKVEAQGLPPQSSGFRVQGAGLRVQGPGFRVQSSGFRVQGKRMP